MVHRTRPCIAVLFVALACGDSGGATTTATTGDPQTTAAGPTTGTSTSTSTGTTAETPTGSGSAEASSGVTSSDPEQTTGPALTATADPSSTGADDTTSAPADTTGTTTTGTGTTGTSTTTSTTADDTTTSALPECDGADVAAIQAAFVECPSPGYIGQTKPISGVTCWDICCAFGVINCGFRAAQADFNACEPSNAPPSGDCSDVFQMAWSSQCNCLN